MIGQTISHYKILEKLGEGGMGVVYKAEDLKLKRCVALKFLPPDLTRDKSAKTRFIHEAQAASALQHHNICTIHEIDDAKDGWLFICMDCYDGETLKEKIARGPLPVEEAVDIASQVAAGLSKAHEAGMVHRDIKPANIMVTRDGVAKLLDFGLAKLAGMTKVTRTGTTVGTVAYMSPEQAKGEEVDARSDIFSLGAVLYEMLTGAVPFPGDHEAAVLYGIIHGEPTPLADLRSDIPGEVDRIVFRLLQKSLEKRYNNASELSVDLQLVKRSLAMRPTRRPFGLWLARQRNTILRIVLPAAAAAVLIGVVLNWAPWRQMRGLRSPEKTAIAQFTFDLQEGHELVMGHGNSLALSPDGKQLVYLAESDGKRKLFLRRMDQLSAKAVEGSDGAVFPFFSPDGDWVGFGAEGKLRKASLETGSVVSLCDAPNLCGGSWSRDGQIAFIPESQAGVHLVSSSGGLSKKLHMRQTESGSAKHWHPFFLPGGNAILTTVWTTSYYEAARVAVVSLKTGDRKILLEDASWPFFLPPDHIVFARRNGLYAVRFDPLRMELRGEPFKLFEALTEPNDSHFAVSANGTLVLASGLDQDARPSWKEERAYWREERVPVWVERSGAVHPVPLPPGPYAFPNVSPDGTKLALSVFREKAVENWMLDVESGVFSRLTVDRNDHISVWSPDGKQIAMSSATSGVPNIYVMPVDGTAPPERLTVSEFHQDPASWSPDGRFLTFLDFFTQNQFDIWLIDLTRGRESRPLIKTQFDERHAMISPDGKCMAYTSNRSGQREIYVCSFPDGNAIGQVTSEGGSDPLWSRDGRELFFWEWNKKVDQDDHEPLSLMAMTVGTHDGMRFGKPTPLFKRSWVYHNGGRPNYDVAPDGRFVMLDYKGETSSITRLRVLLNWLDELED